jgi:hypothetical protein
MGCLPRNHIEERLVAAGHIVVVVVLLGLLDWQDSHIDWG